MERLKLKTPAVSSGLRFPSWSWDWAHRLFPWASNTSMTNLTVTIAVNKLARLESSSTEESHSVRHLTAPKSKIKQRYETSTPDDLTESRCSHIERPPIITASKMARLDAAIFHLRSRFDDCNVLSTRNAISRMQLTSMVAYSYQLGYDLLNNTVTGMRYLRL